ncbi:hypothetical protein O6P43_018490 [Quillaja saponaria]|uniref:Uncharacterized protein n=1 Tax=Quillaja saponaria TaxID=32244 RepID=A0AAD7LS82_QUISA|nr:hypothetical protein O6P43_018490 [Quillaja saponaria]
MSYPRKELLRLSKRGNGLGCESKAEKVVFLQSLDMTYFTTAEKLSLLQRTFHFSSIIVHARCPDCEKAMCVATNLSCIHKNLLDFSIGKKEDIREGGQSSRLPLEQLKRQQIQRRKLDV